MTLMRYLSLILFLLVGQCQKEGSDQLDPSQSGQVVLAVEQVQKAQIKTTVAVSKPISSKISLSGKIALRDDQSTRVLSPVSGQVKQILVDVGHTVKKGEPLALLDSPDVGLASSDLKKAQYVLRSPIDGEILSRTVSSGMEIQSQSAGGAPTELFVIGNVEQVYLMADGLESDLLEIQQGMGVEVHTLTEPEYQTQGVVDWISEGLDPLTHTAKIRCRLSNKEKRLKPEMYVTAFVKGKQASALVIPKDAVLQTGEQNQVFVEDQTTQDGKVLFKRMPILIEESTEEGMIPVIQGLTSGMKVVSQGAILLSEES